MTPNDQIDQIDVRRVALFRALFLGDLICALPSWRALRERFPGAEITLIGLPWAEEFAARTGLIDHFAPFPGYQGIQEVPYEPGRTAAFLREARAEPYDLAIQMHGSGQVSNGFVADLGARVSLGYRAAEDGRLTVSLPYRQEEHEAARWLRLVRSPLPGMAPAADAGAPPRTYPTLATTPEERARAAMLLAAPPGAGPLVALHAGAKDPTRRWPAERFAALGDALATECGARIVLTGGAGEREITGAVRRLMRAEARDLAGETDLGTFAALIGRLDLLVTNDTGASHLAATTATPSVVLFGPSRPEQWAPPDRERHRAIDSLALAEPGADPASALARLPVETVLAACFEALRREPAYRDGARTCDD
jgi:ADP-heptose:LPS heptosyltransferase